MFSARQMMTTDVVTATPETTLTALIALFETYAVSGVPIVDPTGVLLGVVTEFDLLEKICAHQLRGTVADVMTAETVTIDADATLDEIAEVFLERHIRRVPVTADGKLLGLISRRDLIVTASIRQQICDRFPAGEAATATG